MHKWIKYPAIAVIHVLFILFFIWISLNIIIFQVKGDFQWWINLKTFFDSPVPPLEKRLDRLLMQKNENACGPAALAFALGIYGLDVSEDEISKFAGTTSNGTSMLGLREAADKLGFSAWGEKMNFAALKMVKFPLIAFISNNHYITITGLDNANIYAFDPSRGAIYIPNDAFLKIWDGYVMKIRPQPFNETPNPIASSDANAANLCNALSHSTLPAP